MYISYITILYYNIINTVKRQYEREQFDKCKNDIQEDLIDISNWFKTNKLALNESKTKFIVIHSHHNKPPDSFRITLNIVDLERVDNTKFLGVIIQENLNWKKHIDYICERVSRATAL